MSDRLLDRRRFIGVVAATSAAAATACTSDGSCGSESPWRWLTSADSKAAARDALGASSNPWEGLEGSDERITRFRSALDQLALRPRVLADVRRVDLTTTLMGRELSSPLLVAPGVLGLPDTGVGDDATAGALEAGLAFLRDEHVEAKRVGASRQVVCIPWRSFSQSRPGAAPAAAGGVRSVEDAREAVTRGATALVVSNGVERGESGASSIELLPEIRAALPGTVQLIADGAFRYANDVLLALGLGATAVTVGWPLVWGAAAAGPLGAFRAMEILHAGLARGLRLCGRPRVRDISTDLVRRVPIL